jgi:hypothetical protein
MFGFKKPKIKILDYIHYKNETHNSLGFKSICAGFEMIYKDWRHYSN